MGIEPDLLRSGFSFKMISKQALMRKWQCVALRDAVQQPFSAEEQRLVKLPIVQQCCEPARFHGGAKHLTIFH